MDLANLGITGAVVATLIVGLQNRSNPAGEALSLTPFVDHRRSFALIVLSIRAGPVSLRNTNVGIVFRRCRVGMPVDSPDIGSVHVMRGLWWSRGSINKLSAINKLIFEIALIEVRH